MTLYVFVGPTLDKESAEAVLGAEYLPPAAMGDVYRASLEGPFAIGIIDGYFERVPAVWHKEVLWALSRGIHVFGASSMGALRAAELHSFGMQGVGVIFEAYRSGELQDDDEVAITHGGADTGFRPGSEALVNMRATLRRAESEGVIDAVLRSRLEQIAKDTFYPDRNYAPLLATARIELGAERELEGLREFIASRRVDQKREDAFAMLEAMRACQEKGEPPPSPLFELANSEPWTQLRSWARGRPRLGTDSSSQSPRSIAAEARCCGERGRTIVASAFSRALAAALGCVGWRQRFASELDEHIVEEARQVGLYDELTRRAADKQRVLSRHGFGTPTLDDAKLPRAYVIEWYLNAIGCDLEVAKATEQDSLHQLGLTDSSELEAEALREFLYLRLVPGSNSHR